MDTEGSPPVPDSLIPCARIDVILRYNIRWIRVHTTKLRRVGGSIMLAVPPPVLDLLQLRTGDEVGLDIERGRLIVAPRPRPRYTLEELLARCHPGSRRGRKDREWLEAPPVGRELL